MPKQRLKIINRSSWPFQIENIKPEIIFLVYDM